MGREFLHVFEEWADEYDDCVAGNDPEYVDVFRGYNRILQEVADFCSGKVLEFGPGTGNLTEKLLSKGLSVTAIEPSATMRRIAEEKIKSSHVTFLDGDFFQFPADKAIETIVSTYAFHHLNAQEKAQAVKQYGKMLQIDGKIVFADTMFISENAHNEAIKEAESKGFRRLADDLRTEYYPTVPFMEKIFKENGFDVTLKRMNSFVWMVNAVKI
ncbi:MAG: class I SAM-dependent methyltransferase [Bacillus sp. (in: firmicutes)]